MAGDWIKIEKDTPRKPEILKMARDLGLEPDAVFGKWVRLWIWFDSNTVDGFVDGVVDADVDAIVSRAGFSRAAERVGWLIINAEKETIKLPNFFKHNGETAKERTAKSDRQKRWRERRKLKASADKKEAVGAYCRRDVDEKTSTREEKRREELKEKIPKKVSKEKFIPPSVDEVTAFCQSKNYQIDPEYFVAYYAKAGWKLSSGQAMKDWQAAVVTWVKNQKRFAGDKKTETAEEMAQRIMAKGKPK